MVFWEINVNGIFDGVDFVFDGIVVLVIVNVYDQNIGVLLVMILVFVDGMYEFFGFFVLVIDVCIEFVGFFSFFELLYVVGSNNVMLVQFYSVLSCLVNLFVYNFVDFCGMVEFGIVINCYIEGDFIVSVMCVVVDILIFGFYNVDGIFILIFGYEF